jgi:hypothetical protein
MNISFADFWPGFIPDQNLFVDLFRSINAQIKVVPPSDSTELLVYSCFGNLHQQFDRSRVVKVFYTGENMRPDFSDCEFSLTFDFDDYNGKNIRLPLWMFHIDWFNRVSYSCPQFMIPPSELRKNRFSVLPKTKFCSIVFSNPKPNRVEILKKLSKYKKVDIFGSPFLNLAVGEKYKYGIISQYKFNICFENTLSPGYYTEKLIHAKLAGCVPLYWSDSNCSLDFNPKAFLNLSDFPSIDEFVEKIIELDCDPIAYRQICNEYLFEGREPSLENVKAEIKRLIPCFS